MNKYNPNIHDRRSIRLKDYDYSKNGLYFITICVEKRYCLLGEIINNEMQLNKTGEIVEKCLLEIPQHYPKIKLHQHIVMSNHLHAIIEIDNANNVGVEYFRPNDMANDINKTISDNDVENERVENIRPLQHNHHQFPLPRPKCGTGTLGAIIRGFKIGVTKNVGFSIFQRNYYEQIIYNEKLLCTISEYIENNPAKWEEDRFNPINNM